MSIRLQALFFCSMVLLVPVQAYSADKNEIEIIIRRGQEHQNKAFQAGPEEKKRHLRKAIDEYEKIYYLAPDEEMAYILAGTCYEHLGEYQKAVETYELGLRRVASRKEKLLLLSNVARVHANVKNFRGAASVIEQMEYLDPRAMEIAAASRDMAMDVPDERMRTLYAEKCVRICDYHVKNGRNAEIRETASNLKRSLEMYLNPGTEADEAAPQGRQYRDPWEGIFSAARRKEYEEVVISHRNMLATASRLDPLCRSYVNAFPAYLPYMNALLGSYSAAGRWEELFEIVRHSLLRRDEIQDESFQRQPVSAILPEISPHLKAYLSTPGTFDFRRPDRAVLIPRLWLYEIKGDDLSAEPINGSNESFPDQDVIAIGRPGQGGRPYRVVLRFSLPQALSGVKIQKAVVTLLRENKHNRAGSNEDAVPVLCLIESAGNRQAADSLPVCPSAGRILPDADSLMRRDIGKAFGGYSAAQLYSFDITPAIMAKQNQINHAAVIMLSDETTRAVRSFWSAGSSHSPKVSIIVKSDQSPGADGFFEYAEDWVDLYAKGLVYLQKGKIGAAAVLWEEAARRSGDQSGARYIREHIAVIRGARQ